MWRSGSYRGRLVEPLCEVKSAVALGFVGAGRRRGRQYVAEFCRDVGTRPYVASPYGNTAGQAAVNRFPGDPAKIRVSMFAPNGQRANYHFVVLVSCS